MLILGIETSCDECSAAVVQGPSLTVCHLATDSQIQIHQPFGGVVPEIASRNHLETVQAVVDQACDEICPQDLDAIAVTNRPGLMGSLLVGVSAAKALALIWKKPLIPVHHLEGHAASIYLEADLARRQTLSELPLLLLIVSGGHTSLYCIQEPPEAWSMDFLTRSCIGRTRDDAAGEAFDKTAKLLGLSYPGGISMDQGAKNGDPQRFVLPRGLAHQANFDFSFSGLKTAVALLIRKEQGSQPNFKDQDLADFCASIQEAIVDALILKSTRAIQTWGCRTMAVVGGVAANSRLRALLQARWREMGLVHPPVFPELRFCTDNAAMIAAAGMFRFSQGRALSLESYLGLSAIANAQE